MKTAIGIFFCLAIVGLAANVAQAAKEAVWQAGDEEIILSQMPLQPLQKMQQLEGEHSANDQGVVFVLIGIEVCNGTPI